MTNTTPPASAGKFEGVLNAVVTSVWLWGGALTFAFYAILPYLPIDQAEFGRYFTAHWIEYATTGLFFVGVVTLVMKVSHLPSERSVLTSNLLDGFDASSHASPVATAQALLNHLNLVARRGGNTLLVRRLRDAAEYVIGMRSSNGLESHLNYLTELAGGRQHAGYSLIRTITWAVPILGFLGTVIGITMAIAGITPDQLESSLPEVTSGLAVAFDTTALSLALSMILVFGTYLVERGEQNLLDDIEDYCVKRVLGLFPSNEPASSPMALAEAEAADQLLKRTEGMITWQMELWQNSLETLRDRWTSTLSRQQDVLDQALQSGLTAALADHTSQLASARADFVSSYQMAASAITNQVATTQAAIVEQQERATFVIAETWKGFRDELALAREADQKQASELTRSMAGEIQSWNERIQTATLAITEQMVELRRQSDALLKLTEGEAELIRLEERLAQNLDSVRVADTLEQTLLNLNAAVNLLSTRTKKVA